MDFVDGQSGHGNGIEQRKDLRPKQRLGGHVEQLCLAAPDVLEVPPVGFRRKGAVQRDRSHAEQGERIDLVLHEGDEGGNDDGQATENEGWDLVAQGLAAARRHDGQAVPSVEHARDHFLLEREEPIVPKDGFQDVPGALDHFPSLEESLVAR